LVRPKAGYISQRRVH